MIDEIWKDIPGFPNYQASSIGRIRSLDRIVPHTGGRTQIKRGKVLSCSPDKFGYLRTCLVNSMKFKTKHVHQLVAFAFIEPRPVGAHINHIDGNKLNNSADNLEICTPSYNLHHAWKMGLRKRTINRTRPTFRKLTDSQIIEIYSLRKSGLSSRRIAADFDVNSTSISRIWNGTRWKKLTSSAS